MQQKDIVELFVRLEKEIDVNAIRCGNIHVWPLIRLELWWALAADDINSIESFQKANISDQSLQKPVKPEPIAASDIAGKITRKIRRTWQTHRQSRVINNLARKQAKLLFIYYDDERHIDNATKYLNKHLDPIAAIARNKGYKTSGLFLYRGEYPSRMKECALSLEPQLLAVKNMTTTASDLELQGSKILDEINNRLPVGARITEEKIKKLVGSYFLYFKWFCTVIDKLRPQTVFYTCYYRIETMALNAACRLRGIKTVDVQHGKQGRNHGLYSHWTRIPEQGYEVLPEYFWCWGNDAKTNMLRHRDAVCKRHQPLVGGYAWLSQVLSDKHDKNISKPYLASFNDYDKNILLCLQPLQEPVPTILVEAMLASPTDWRWLVRLHPRQINSLEIIRETLQGHGVKNFEIDEVNAQPLYTTLAKVDVHITNWSTTLIEALIFDIPSIIVSSQGRDIYNEEIEQGVFAYAENSSDIVKLIKDRWKSVVKGASTNYFETDIKRTENVLLDLLSTV
ncbi:MAG: hypothetical protein RLT87_02700 [Gammaproteobacteria bacterium]